MPTGNQHPSAEIDLTSLFDALGVKGIVVLAALASYLLLRNKQMRKAAHKAARSVLRRMARHLQHALWAWRYGMPIRVARRILERDRWDGMCTARQLAGLKRGKVARTPSGVAVNVTLTRSLTAPVVASRISQLEAGLGLRRGSVRLLAPESSRADKAVLQLTLRDPLAKSVLWQPPTEPVRIADPVHLATTPHGDKVTISAKQRIGIFGTSGSGKSCVQRVLGAHIVQAIDAVLTVIDLKQGLESQHFAGKAHRITNVPDAAAYVDWLLDTEFPRRAARMLEWKTSEWRESETDPALVVMIDEGSVITRDFKPDQLKRIFTAIEQGRAMGVYFVWVTQFPKSTNLPTELRSQLNVRVCLRLESSQESAVVFKDETSEGWEPHKLRDHWLLVKSSKHRAPQEAKGVWLDEKTFRGIRPGRPVTDTPTTAAPAAPVAEPKPKPAAASAKPMVADDLMGALLTSEQPLGVSELARRTGRSKAAVHAALNKLTTDGAVTKGGDNQYSIPLAAKKEQP